MNGGRRRVFGRPVGNGRKDRDEDLVLFHEMNKRDKDRITNLLQPVSDEFEACSGGGNFPFYKFPSAKKGFGNEFLAAEGERNDYDWLKTPPATPLFPSLEMEANGPGLVVQREIPILQFSRFSGNPDTEKTKPQSRSTSVSRRSSNPSSTVSSRSVTPNQRQINISSNSVTTNPKATNVSSTKTTSLRGVSNMKTNQTAPETDQKSKFTIIAAKPINCKEDYGNSAGSTDKLRSNVVEVAAKQKGLDNSAKNSRPKGPSRGVSPSVGSRTPASTMTGFSYETPANLRTSLPNRPSSVTRGRMGNTSSEGATLPESARPRRQSCSPSMARGRKPEFQQQKDRNPADKGNNGTVVLGSKMVERMMNARRTASTATTTTTSKGVVQQETRSKFDHLTEGAGFGRMMSKNSLEMALKHMQIKRNSTANFQHYSVGRPKNSATTSSSSSTDSSPRVAHLG